MLFFACRDKDSREVGWLNMLCGVSFLVWFDSVELVKPGIVHFLPTNFCITDGLWKLLPNDLIESLNFQTRSAKNFTSKAKRVDGTPTPPPPELGVGVF